MWIVPGVVKVALKKGEVEIKSKGKQESSVLTSEQQLNACTEHCLTKNFTFCATIKRPGFIEALELTLCDQHSFGTQWNVLIWVMLWRERCVLN